jgi:hypothetical protein
MLTLLLAFAFSSYAPTQGDTASGQGTNSDTAKKNEGPAVTPPIPRDTTPVTDLKAVNKDTNPEYVYQAPPDEGANLADWVIAFFAFASTVVAGTQLFLYWKQDKAVHRPSVILRYVRLDAQADGSASIAYLFANLGGTTATVIDGFVAIAEWPKNVRLPDPEVLAAEYRMEIKANTEIAPGKRLPLTQPAGSKYHPISGSHQPASQTLYAWGRLTYKDEIGLPRETAFIRQYNALTGRFDVVSDSDYEYRE